MRPRSARPLRRLAELASVLLLVVIFLAAPAWTSGLTQAPVAAPSVALPLAAAVAPSVPAAVTVPPVAQPVGVQNSSGNVSGPGTFYLTSSLPNAAFVNETCVAGTCYNTSNDVTVNTTSSGLIAVAYTSLTDQSPCASLRPYSVSNIAFLSSTNGGASWSPVQYLGNSQCSGKSLGYPDAWEPSLTSLGDGTLVLVYVEYNLTAGALPPLTPTSWPPVQSRLVLTESVDSGATWSTPTVLNISNPASAPPGTQFTPAHPSVTAFGDSIYVTWMALSFADTAGSIGFITSSTGGATWSPTIPVSQPYSDYSMNPSVMVDPAGEVFIAFVTDISYNGFVCGPYSCIGYDYGVYAGDVEVASSTSNGTVFSYDTVAYGIPVDSPGWDPVVNPTSFGPFQTPDPQLGYSEANQTVIVAFTGGVATNGTTQCVYPTAECLTGGLYYYLGLFNGSFYEQGNIENAVFNPNYIDPSSGAVNATDSITSLALAVEPGGQVDLEAGFFNGSICYGTACGAESEVVFSTLNGTTFTPPATVVSTAYTPDAYAWNGETGAVALVDGQPQFYWVSDSCPAWRTAPCTSYPGSGAAVAQVQLSSYFTGTGSTLSFTATGLPSDINWSISVMGNVRTGAGNATLSVTGVPDGVSIFYEVPNVNLTSVHYLVQSGSLSPVSPVSLGSGTTSISPHFKEYVPVTISYTVPTFSGYPCTLGYCPTFYPTCDVPPPGYPTDEDVFISCYSLYFTSGAPSGGLWEPIGAPISLGITALPYPMTIANVVCITPPIGYYAFCYDTIYNLTFLGWAGAGPGSVSTPQTNITVAPLGAVTETASFLITGACSYYAQDYSGTIQYFYFYGCGNYSAPVTVDEQGLPSGTTWGVDLSNTGGFSSTDLATAPASITIAAAPLGFMSFRPWNIPGANPAEVWEASSSVGSEVFLPIAAPITVTYTLVNYSAIDVPVQISALGLPTSLDTNLTLEDLSTSGPPVPYTAPSTGLTLNLPAGNYVVNASPILTESGVRYYPVAVFAAVSLLNSANQSAVLPATVLLGGPAVLQIDYTPSYYVSVTAGPGGSASPGSQWVTAGGSLTLRATPNANFQFLEWTGSGKGATSGAQAALSQVVIQPTGPVNELATFAPVSAPTWTVHAVPSGLPAGQTYSMTLGGTTYTGTGTLTIRGLATGTYGLSFPAVAVGSSTLTRFVETSVTATAGLSGSQLSVTQNLTVLPVYATQYFVTTAAAGPGTLSLGPGAFWENANSTLTVTAVPSTGYILEGWVASFDGGPSTLLSNLTTVSVTLTGSVALVARFVPAPPTVPATYSYALMESGLPSGTSWSFTLSGTSGAAGATATLSATGLNGSYLLSVPIVYLTSGIRFVPSLVENTSVVVTANVGATVTFAEQVLVTVAASGNGTASGGGWYGAGSSVDLVAGAAPAGWSFAGWQGSGVGSYTGTNATETIAPTGPITETASFVLSTTSSTGSSAPVSMSDWAAIAIIVIVLAAVGILEGRLLARRRRPPPGRPFSGAMSTGGPASETPALESP